MQIAITSKHDSAAVRASRTASLDWRHHLRRDYVHHIGRQPREAQTGDGHHPKNAIIALVLYFAMWAVLNWLTPGGLFD